MVKEKAYAKINLFLNVVGKRVDGFHNLEMIMAPLKLHDEIRMKKILDKKEIKISSNIEITKNTHDNIVYKVAKFVLNEFEIKTGVDITIHKKIPMGAGLAGGSANAAAVLRGLNRLYKLNLSLEDMAKIGEKFGADIPFCIYNKLCIAKGKGEDLLFVNTKLKSKVILVYPDINVSTKQVFSKIDEENLIKIKINDMSQGVYNRNYELITRSLYNSLENVTFELYPKIKEIKHQLLDFGLKGVLMSGSGSTVFAIENNRQKIKQVKEVYEEKCTVILTRFK
ncbi:4-(cytidine 5'-diphospho)-2-C-methyl-D-erythritol kinase [Candidatus Izimaplasma bacterium ZiA1]|uniref:4-(cytidine 5'-diphospho)-2-C-methyl-D-erythritol kinase n=1 Tax=Candidatus Izimoplasma sp. ZiA1 TaxID=2024899 RepID=UPI000BAA80C2|nr:4-(cytidine 5'-diphospho)-2-C-methyl-D-erythritol kinase [Candidatus Izimaplasma bacterium ZiA1]